MVFFACAEANYHDILPRNAAVPRAEAPAESGPYRSAAFILSSIAEPGQRSFSPSLLKGVSKVLRWAWRSSASGARYKRPVRTSPLAAALATMDWALILSLGS